MKQLFQPNLWKTGRILRGLIGLILLVAAVSVARFHWLACAGLAMAGAFCLFEALRGWCVARAGGVKTRW